MAVTQSFWYYINAIFIVHVYFSSVAASNTSCPTWFYFNNTSQQCECGKSWGGIQCNQQEKKVEIELGNCVTYAGQEGLYYVGGCPYIPTTNNTNRMLSELPRNHSLLNDALCGPYNREGLLCGRCIDGYGPAVFLFDRKCADCSEQSMGYIIILYLFLKFIPITLFFMCVLFFRINITSGPLLGYVVFCQLYMAYLQYWLHLYVYIYSHVSESTKILFHSSLTLSDMWSLQYFRFVLPPLCLSTKLTDIHIELFGLATAIYPIILVIITCILMELHARNYRIIHILWKPISIPLKKLNITSVTSDALIHTFATFILLSSYSLTSTGQNLCSGQYVRRSTDGTSYKHILYHDPTVTWFSSKHIPCLLTAAVIFIFLLFIPSLLLFVYPTRIYGYLSQYVSIRKRLAITAFVEALQNCFKDGLNGTRDYRALAGLFVNGLLVGELIEAILRMITTGNNDLIFANFSGSLTFILLSFIISYVRPCKATLANLSLSYHSMVLGILGIVSHLWRHELSMETKPLIWMFIAVPMISHVLVSMWAAYTLACRIRSHFGCQFNCRAITNLASALNFHRRRSSYQVLPDTATQ